MPAQSPKPIVYPSLHEQSAGFPPVDWLWPAWLPVGMLTLLGAAPGVGKSLVALDLARRIIHDEPFPDGAPVPCPGSNVLIVDAEGPTALLNQRVQAWDVDSRRLFLVPPPARLGLFDLIQPDQIELLIRMIANIRPALVIVDSLAAAAPRAESSPKITHELPGGLAALAREARTALLIIHHLRKRTSSGWAPAAPRAAADDLRGTSRLGAAARSILGLTLLSQDAAVPPTLVGKVVQPTHGWQSSRGSPKSPIQNQTAGPQPQSIRRLEFIKTNLCRLPPPLALSFEGGDDAVPPTPGQPGTATDPRSARFTGVPTLRYTEYAEPPPPPTQTDLCARWLLDYLAATGAPARPVDIVRAAAAQGFPRATVYRARNTLGELVVELGNSRYDPNKRWTLAPQDPASEDEPSDQDTAPGCFA